MSTSSPISKALVALATLAVAGGTLVLGVAAQAGSATAAAKCVAVVVDFSRLGGSVQTGCAQGDPSTGLQALTKAGFSYTPRARDGLICRINAQPNCNETTTSTYWSYWYRAAGSTKWVYATQGAGSHNPKPGSTEGWVWQDGGKAPPPGIRAETICPQLTASPAPAPTKTKPKPKPTKPKVDPPTSGSPISTTGSTAGATSATATATGRHSSGATGSATSSAPSTSPAPSSQSPVAAVAAAPSDDSSTGSASEPADSGGGALGGGAGLALGGAVVVGIGAATAIRARRGRSP